jgi:murein DD-endopeptidase MepM/ murein hydrolase activator NlpD
MTRLMLGCLTAAVALLTGVTTPAAAVRELPGEPGYQWPLRPAPDRILRDFDPPARPWLPGNRGLDLAGRPGEAVHAAASGVVTFAGQVGGIDAIAITFGALRTTYEPVHPSVRPGQQVRVGQVIGQMEAATLHWGLLRGTDYLDPLALLGLEQVRLLPLEQLAGT